MTPPPELALVGESTARLLERVGGITDATVAAPSALRGWTVGHVLTHLARNADAHRRMAEGAARGEVVDRYEDGDAGRAGEIERGAGRPAAVLVDDLRTAAARLEAAWAAMPSPAWDAPIAPPEGRARLAPRSRLIELEVHRVDLGLGDTPADWHPGFVDVGLAAVIEHISRSAATVGPRMAWHLSRADGPGEWLVRRDLFGTSVVAGRAADAGFSADCAVTGPGAELLAWLLDRRPLGPGLVVHGDAERAASLPAAYRY